MRVEEVAAAEGSHASTSCKMSQEQERSGLSPYMSRPQTGKLKWMTDTNRIFSPFLPLTGQSNPFMMDKLYRVLPPFYQLTDQFNDFLSNRNMYITNGMFILYMYYIVLVLFLELLCFGHGSEHFLSHGFSLTTETMME